MTSTATRRISALGAAILALLAGLLGFGATTAASAAELPIVDPSGITLTHRDGSTTDPISQWEAVRVTFPFDSVGTVKAGDTFGISFPGVFGVTDPTWNVTDPDGVVVATCTVTDASSTDTQGTIVCTFTEAAESYSRLQGEVTAFLQANSATDEETVSFGTVSGEVVIPLPGDGGGIIGHTPSYPEDLAKYGWLISGTEDELVWFVFIPAGSVDTTSTITIEDVLGPNQTYIPGTFSLEQLADRATETYTAVPGGYTTTPSADGTSATVTIDPNVLDPNAAYRLQYKVKVSVPPTPGTVFTNSADINGTHLNSSTGRDFEGGGHVIPAGFGEVALSKIVDGTGAADIPAGTTYTVTATWDAVESGTTYHYSVPVVLTAGAAPMTLSYTRQSDGETTTFIPTGTVVTFAETPPAAVPGATWSSPVFVPGSTVTIAEKVTTAIAVTNTATKIETPTPTPTPPVTTTPATTAPETTAPVTTAPVTTAPVTTVPSTTAPATPGQPGTPGLATTGAEGLAPLGALAGVLLLAGLGAIAANRRRA